MIWIREKRFLEETVTPVCHKRGIMLDSKKNRMNLIILIVLAVLLRFFLSALSRGFFTDINLFMTWSKMLSEWGPAQLYETSCDYPPGYMYILWAMGALLRWLESIEASYKLSVLITKLPAIICDVMTALLVYKIVLEKHDDRKALLFSALYLFNPAILINASVWGQVDSILCFIELLVIYLVYKRNMCLSYLVFCLGFLLKPQIIFIAPIVLFGIIDNVFIRGFKWKNFMQNLISGLLSIGMSLLLCIPFNLSKTIAQYSETISSYPYASINAYNFWTMQGYNWVKQDTLYLKLPIYVWGYLFIALVCLTVFYMWFKVYKEKRSSAKSYLYLAAFIIIGVYTFSVRMHERYMFPALVMLLLLCAFDEKRKNYLMYGMASLIHLINVWLIYDDCYCYEQRPVQELICGTLMTCFYIWLIHAGFKLFDSPKSEVISVESVG